MRSAQQRPRKRAARHLQYIELAQSPLAPVEAAVSNQAADNQPVVYIRDAARSVLTLTLTNQTKRDLTLKGAAAVPADMNNAGAAAAVYLDFQKLLDANELAGLSVSAGIGWHIIFFSDARLWGLCPVADIPWPANGVISITIGKLLVSKEAGNAALDLYYVNFDQPNRQFRELKVLVQNPPGDKANAEISADVDNQIILITPPRVPPIQNTISIDLANNQTTTLNAGADTIFYLSFVYGTAPGYGALMARGSPPPDLAVTQPGGDGWNVSLDTTGKTPFWRLRPTGKLALGTRDADTAVFEISGISVPDNFVVGPTAVYVQWSYLPGYRDGHTRVILQKRMPKPSVELDAVGNIVDYGAKPVLRWQTVAVPYLQLSYSAYGRGRVLLPATDTVPLPLQVPNPATHSNGFEIPDGIRESTTFYLAGYNSAPPPGQEPQDSPTADASCTVTVQHPTPKIKAFEVLPAAWPFELGSTSVTLKWTIDWIETFGERSLTLDGQTLAADQTSYTVANVAAPQKWTLKAQGSGGLFSQAEAELRAQTVTDYLYHPPRRYKATGTLTGTVTIHTTVELILSDIDHNTLNFTIEDLGPEPMRDQRNFAAKIERGIFVIPSSGDDPEGKIEDRKAPLHFRIAPGVLILLDPPDSQAASGMPTTLYEEKS